MVCHKVCAIRCDLLLGMCECKCKGIVVTFLWHDFLVQSWLSFKVNLSNEC